MLRGVCSVLTIGFFAAGGFARETRPANAATVEETQTSGLSSLRGVWKVTEQASRVLGADWTVTTAPHLSLYIFTEKHYSYLYTLGPGPRQRFVGDPNRPTDSEKVAAYDSFVASSGTYTLSGSTLTLDATLHKNPNEMVGEPLKFSAEIDANTLRLTIVSPPFSPGQERRTVLMRVE